MDSLKVTDEASAAVAVAPRVSLDSMKEKIAFTHFLNAGEVSRAASGMTPEQSNPSLDVLTICLLVMQNGFTVIGKAAPASPENFNRELGQQFAFEDAIRQLWPLEGYALRERLHQERQAGL